MIVNHLAKRVRQKKPSQASETGSPETKQVKTGLDLKTIKPLTVNQQKTFDSWWGGKNLWLYGCAGTGKSYISLYLAMQAVIKDESHEKVVIVRSAVSSRDMGFLPGKISEKQSAYEDPYKGICSDLFGRGDAYSILKQKGKLEFLTTSYNRGITISNAIIFVDETQNMTVHEIDTIFTRVGKNTKIIFAGDLRQTDLNKGRERSGILDAMAVIKAMRSFDLIEFTIDDVVRSGLVREYLLARHKLEVKGVIETL